MLRFKRISSYVIACIALVSLAILPSKLTAQVAEGINYQAVVRDASNNVLGNTDISVQFSIVANSATGTTVYQELHNDTPTSLQLRTNESGLFNLVIGRGTRNGGTLNTFDQINWSSGSYFLKVEIAVGTNQLEELGTTELVSVPYALYAKSSGNTLGINATQDSLILSNGGGSVALTDFGISSGDNQNLRFSTNGDSILIEDGNGVGIQFILDDITNNTVNISNNQTSISNESASRSAADNNLSTRLVNDSSNLVDTAAVLRALIPAASQDDQNLSFSPTRDSILIENGTGIRIQFIIDTATNLRSSIGINSTSISGNQTAIIRFSL